MLQILAILLVALGALESAAALSVRAMRPRGSAIAPALVRVPAPLSVGAGTQPIDLSPRRPLAGFGLFRPPARTSDGPWEARAIVIGKLAIVSLDVLEIPPSLSAVVERTAGPDLTVWLCATHTHSGPGGYDPERLPQLAGARRFEPGVFNALAEAASQAIATAVWNARPAKLRWARASHPELKIGRHSGSTPEPSLWALRAEDEAGRPIATVVGFGAHPTLVPRKAAQASPDWPGAAAEALESDGGGVAIVVQAIGGDSSAARDAETGADPHSAYGRQVASAAQLALAAAPLTSPGDERVAQAPVSLEWNPLDGVHIHVPGTRGQVSTAVRAAALGNLLLVCLPGELTGAAWQDLTAGDPLLEGAWPITLCGDELSYVESPRLFERRLGERLVLYPHAVPELGQALRQLLPGLARE